MDLNQMISINPATLGMLTALLLGVGKALKSIKKFPNEFIPIALAVVGGVGIGFLDGFKPATVMIGIISGLSAVGAHQVVNQVANKPEEPAKAVEPPKAPEPPKPDVPNP